MAWLIAATPRATDGCQEKEVNPSGVPPEPCPVQWGRIQETHKTTMADGGGVGSVPVTQLSMEAAAGSCTEERQQPGKGSCGRRVVNSGISCLALYLEIHLMAKAPSCSSSGLPPCACGLCQLDTDLDISGKKESQDPVPTGRAYGQACGALDVETHCGWYHPWEGVPGVHKEIN